MKKSLTYLSIITMVAASLCCMSCKGKKAPVTKTEKVTLTEKDFRVIINDYTDEVEIQFKDIESILKPNTIYVIPSNLEGVAITNVNLNYFNRKDDNYFPIEGIEIEEGVKSIDITGVVKKLILPDSCQELSLDIGALEEIKFPSGIKELGLCSFVNCQIKEMIFPESIEVLTSGIFFHDYWESTYEEPDETLRELNANPTITENIIFPNEKLISRDYQFPIDVDSDMSLKLIQVAKQLNKKINENTAAKKKV